MRVITIGLHLAKHWFQVHGGDAAGKIVVKRRLRRLEVVDFFMIRNLFSSVWRPVRRRIIGRVR